MEESDKSPEAKAWNCVFAHLSTQHLMVVGHVCRQWRRLSRQPHLWRSLRLDYPKLTGAVSEEERPLSIDSQTENA